VCHNLKYISRSCVGYTVCCGKGVDA
jgi:hypothetical protein